MLAPDFFGDCAFAVPGCMQMGVHEMGLRRAILMGMAENSHEEAAKAADRDEVSELNEQSIVDRCAVSRG